MNKAYLRRQGFTLLEMLVSIAIVALLSTVLSQVFITTLRLNTKTELLKDMKQNGELALETMIRLIQNAKRVDCVSSQSILITSTDDGQTSLECALTGTTTRIASTSATGTSYLTSTSATLGGVNCTGSTLMFACVSAAGQPTTVTVSFRLSQAGIGSEAFNMVNEQFQSSATTRNIAN